jgi:hypothetical protein
MHLNKKIITLILISESDGRTIGLAAMLLGESNIIYNASTLL